MMNNLPIYNIILNEEEGLTAMSLVQNPAVESAFIAFNEQQKLTFSVNDEEHIVTGCALRADHPIYRYNPQIGEYYVVFSKEVIKELYQKFFKDNLINNVNLEHNTFTDCAYLIQSFVKDEEMGINPKGFEDCANGSWFVSYKITDEGLWQEIKQGNLTGFSVEMFAELERKFEKQDEPEMDLFDEILKEI